MWHRYELALCPRQTLPEQPDIASCTCPNGDSQGDAKGGGKKRGDGDSLEGQGQGAAVAAASGREGDSKARFASPKGRL